ncbi:uncharacterized protein LOC131071435 isoform X2 [Cryptomeria japonica]|uniref:uncharacterized protein LOC131071435 isoform X2 n=1 Tax=Cryptomeria japonica TaxID=3369 RepID=UPI0027DA2BE3|nr:uncharacterized protein LOC131071435 isoform X2 [Cryptomeria japonica]
MKKAWSLRRLRCVHAATRMEPSPSPISSIGSTLPSSSSASAGDSQRWFHHLYGILFSNSSRFRGPRMPESEIAYDLSKVFGSVLATVISVGLVTVNTSLNVAFAEANDNENQISGTTDAISFSEENNEDIEKVVRQVRERVQENLQKSNTKGGLLPSFTVAAKGQQVAVKFTVSHSCDLSHLIAYLVSSLGLKTVESGGGAEMILRAWESAVARQFVLLHPDQYVTQGGETEQRVGMTEGGHMRKTTLGDSICVLVFEPLIGSSNAAEIEFLKRAHFTIQELDALTNALIIASGSANTRGAVQKKNKDALKRREKQNSGPKFSSETKALEALEAMGVKIYGLEALNGSFDKDIISWDNLAGYHEQKREIEDTVLLALQHPEIYDNIAKGTRCKYESNRPRAVLFEGPPGTGKTSCARVIASQAGVPLLYVPLEVVMSKYYGESERLLGSIFNLANELPNGAIIFLDEVDALAAARDKEMHEATRRMLSILLRQIDGFEQEKRVVVIAATNRRQDLDPALISMSGRDLRDVCQQAERYWASKLIRGQIGEQSTDGLPPIQEYLVCAEKRQRTLLKWHDEDLTLMGDDQHAISRTKKWSSVMA